MADVCDISQLPECMAKGHEPLDIGDGDGSVTGVDMLHSASQVAFGCTFFCKRCGLLYWGPKPTVGDEGPDDG